MSESESLIERYHRELERLGHTADPAQLAAVMHLDRLQTRLCNAIRPRSVWTGLLTREKRYELQRGLYLWGGVGRGKTWLMDLFFQRLPFKDKQRSHFHRFMQFVHHELKKHHDRADPLELVAEHIAKKNRLLCFDELFVADIADAMLLGNLFRGLFDRGVTLVTTSNAPPDELYKNGLQRARFLPAIRLLKEHTEVLNVDSGIDYRLRHMQNASTRFDAADSQTGRGIAELFEKLTEGDFTQDGHLELNQRRIKTRRQSKGLVWFEFGELCDGPRGQADYIEIARCYHTVFISQVPPLTATMENQARRFVSMIDEFYDRGVKLFVSAMTSVEQIYQGSQLSFEFERTRSRLIEMQSHKYLALPHKP
jgi:cell division protein ZapE